MDFRIQPNLAELNVSSFVLIFDTLITCCVSKVHTMLKNYGFEEEEKKFFHLVYDLEIRGQFRQAKVATRKGHRLLMNGRKGAILFSQHLLCTLERL